MKLGLLVSLYHVLLFRTQSCLQLDVILNLRSSNFKIIELTNLSELFLHKCAISDQGAFHLVNLQALEILDLSETNITDVTLAEFHRAALFKLKLKKLDLTRARISDQGVTHLQGT